MTVTIQLDDMIVASVDVEITAIPPKDFQQRMDRAFTACGQIGSERQLGTNADSMAVAQIIAERMRLEFADVEGVRVCDPLPASTEDRLARVANTPEHDRDKPVTLININPTPEIEAEMMASGWTRDDDPPSVRVDGGGNIKRDHGHDPDCPIGALLGGGDITGVIVKAALDAIMGKRLGQPPLDEETVAAGTAIRDKCGVDLQTWGQFIASEGFAKLTSDDRMLCALAVEAAGLTYDILGDVLGAGNVENSEHANHNRARWLDVVSRMADLGSIPFVVARTHTTEPGETPWIEGTPENLRDGGVAMTICELADLCTSTAEGFALAKKAARDLKVERFTGQPARDLLEAAEVGLADRVGDVIEATIAPVAKGTDTRTELDRRAFALAGHYMQAKAEGRDPFPDSPVSEGSKPQHDASVQ